MADYVSVAARKLRAQKSKAAAVHVFLTTNHFREDQAQYHNSMPVSLPRPSSYTPALIKAALHGLKGIYRPGYQYKKAGIMLTGLISDNCRQLSLFQLVNPESTALMAAVDGINAKWGRNTLSWAASGLEKPWAMRQDHKSPSYTTDWQGPVGS